MTLDAIRLFAYTMFHATIILLPIFCTSTVANEKLKTSPFVSLGIGACFSGLFAYLVFWTWVIDPLSGKIFILTSYFGMTAMVVRMVRKGAAHGDGGNWLAMATLWISFSIFILALGMTQAGNQDILIHAASRFSHALPIDNQLPFILAKQVSQGHIQSPMIGDWLASDRPPLQAAYFLTSGTIGSNHSQLHYQIHSTLLQCLWIIPLAALLRAFQVNRLAVPVVLAAAMFNSVSIVHGFFTWPKLLPVFFIILLFGILFAEKSDRESHWITAVAAGALSALAMLTHGGSIFIFLGIGVAVLLFRTSPSIKFALLAISSAILLMGTWSYYQAAFDPPGNRLLKWHLAGVIPIDGRSLTQALLESYQALSSNEIYEIKKSNFTMLIGNPSEWIPNLIRSSFGSNPADARRALQAQQFFHMLAAIGYLLIAAMFFFNKPGLDSRTGFELGKRLTATGAASTIIWCLMLFGPHATSIHQGSLAVMVFFFSGAALILASTSIPLALAVVSLQTLSFAFTYFPGNSQAPNSSSDWTLFFLAALSAAAIGVVYYKLTAKSGTAQQAEGAPAQNPAT